MRRMRRLLFGDPVQAHAGRLGKEDAGLGWKQGLEGEQSCLSLGVGAATGHSPRQTQVG